MVENLNLGICFLRETKRKCEDTETERRVKEALMKFITFGFEEAYVQYKDK